MATTSDKSYYTLEQLAEKWSVEILWIRRQIWSGQIKAVKFGRQIRVTIAEAQRFEASRPPA